MSDLKTRLLSAAALLPGVLLLVYIGQWPYILLIAAVTLLAGREYVQMLTHKGYPLSLPVLWGFILFWLAAAVWGDGDWVTPGLTGLYLFSVLWSLFRRARGATTRYPTVEWALLAAGGTYIGVTGAYLLRVRALPGGLWWTLTALLIIWVGESAAYFIGSRWGRHKIAPAVSPGKSWEGFAGELVSSVLTGLLLGWLWPAVAGSPLTLTPATGALLGGMLSLLTPAGDFFVSMIKREVGVKDTSALIPGHGGMFDRIDSLLWTGFLTWTVVQLLG